jgi:ABC-type sugar transport system ATPase subunit
MITLTVAAVSKRYGATRALDGLDLSVASGEITGIAGSNGSGKSTLMRMLAGEETPDSGSISLSRDGIDVPQPWKYVAVVHQEPQLWPNMTVRENLAVGRERRAIGVMEPAAKVDATLDTLGIAAYVDYALADLSLAVQQRVEIARALLCDADVFLFDEPNSALTDAESESFFTTMHALAAAGKVVLLITHRLNDFVRCCRRVLVLRDGRIFGTITGTVTEAQIASELTADVVTATEFRSAASGADDDRVASVVVSLRHCHDPMRLFHDISFDIWAGRILVLAGVEGSGARELAQAIGGFRRVAGSFASALDRQPHAAYLAADRRETVFPNLSVGDSLSIRVGWLKLSAPMPLLDYGRIAVLAAKGIIRYGIKTGSPEHSITSLSGGNQQKVVLGAAIEEDPDILVVEEPTRGVDVASKRDIYVLLRKFARSGKAVVLFCTEVPEIYEIADEMIVMSRGNVTGRISADQVDSLTALSTKLAELEKTHHDAPRLSANVPPRETHDAAQ